MLGGSGCGGVAPSSDGGGDLTSGDAITIAMLPKFKEWGTISCATKVGAEEAVQELKDAGKDVTHFTTARRRRTCDRPEAGRHHEGWIAQA